MGPAQIDAGVKRALATRDRVVLRISGGGPGDDLRAVVTAAVNSFHKLWDEQEVADADGLLPPPNTLVSTVPPNVVVNVTEIHGGEILATRLVQALREGLPGSARVRALHPTPPSRTATHTACLELRIALTAHDEVWRWSPAPDVSDRTDALAHSWLTTLGGDTQLHLGLPGGGLAPIAAVDLPATLHAKRVDDWRGRFVASNGTQVRESHFSYRSAHLSLLTGLSTAEATNFDWRQRLEQLEDALMELDSLVTLAYVRHTSNANEVCSTSHLHRRLWEVEHRHDLLIEKERRIEESGQLVDAQGVAYLSQPPTGLPDDWQIARISQSLFRVTAPELESWLKQPASIETVNAARRELAASSLGPHAPLSSDPE